MPSEITLQTAEDCNSAYFRESMLLLSMLFGGVISVFPWKIISQGKNMTNKWFRTQLSHRSSLSDPPYWISLSHLKLSCFFEVYLLWFYHNPQSFSISSWLDSPIHQCLAAAFRLAENSGCRSTAAPGNSFPFHGLRGPSLLGFHQPSYRIFCPPSDVFVGL